jgi:phytol kinase
MVLSSTNHLILGFALAGLGMLIILFSAEVLWRQKIIKGEAARKFVHILAGIFIAFWPYFMSWRQIELLAAGGLILVFIAINTNVFHVGRDINRRSYGELFFPIGIGISALIMPAPIVFTAAILHLSLADGLAALVGKKYGQRHQYKITGYTKSLAGSLTFLLTSLVIITSTLLVSASQPTWPLIPLLVCLPLAATLLENFAIAGADNLLIPLLVVVVLRAAKIS